MELDAALAPRLVALSTINRARSPEPVVPGEWLSAQTLFGGTEVSGIVNELEPQSI